VVGLVGLGSRIAVVDVATQDTVDEDGELSSGGGDGLGLADPSVVGVFSSTIAGMRGGRRPEMATDPRYCLVDATLL
jgi:hypothetical protein